MSNEEYEVPNDLSGLYNASGSGSIEEMAQAFQGLFNMYSALIKTGFSEPVAREMTTACLVRIISNQSQ